MRKHIVIYNMFLFNRAAVLRWISALMARMWPCISTLVLTHTEMRMWSSATPTREATGVRRFVKEAFLSAWERSSRWGPACACVCRLETLHLCLQACARPHAFLLERPLLYLWSHHFKSQFEDSQRSVIHATLGKGAKFKIYTLSKKGIEVQFVTSLSAYFPFFSVCYLDGHWIHPCRVQGGFVRWLYNPLSQPHRCREVLHHQLRWGCSHQERWYQVNLPPPRNR